MIRSVLMVALRPGTTDEQVEAFGAALGAVPFERRRTFTFGRDLGVREDNMDIAWVADFDDLDAYRDWLADPAHRAVSAELLHPIAAQVVRCQFAL